MLLANSTTEEQVHYTTSTSVNKGTQNSPGRSTRPFFFCGSKQQQPRNICPASGQTCNYCRKTGQQAAKDHRTSKPTFQKPPPSDPRREHIRMVEQDENCCAPPEEGIQYENCFTLTDEQPSNGDTTALAPPPLHPAPTDKGHFVLLDLTSSDSRHSTQVPFQIDSAASWAKV